MARFLKATALMLSRHLPQITNPKIFSRIQPACLFKSTAVMMLKKHYPRAFSGFLPIIPSFMFPPNANIISVGTPQRSDFAKVLSVILETDGGLYLHCNGKKIAVRGLFNLFGGLGVVLKDVYQKFLMGQAIGLVNCPYSTIKMELLADIQGFLTIKDNLPNCKYVFHVCDSQVVQSIMLEGTLDSEEYRCEFDLLKELTKGYIVKVYVNKSMGKKEFAGLLKLADFFSLLARRTFFLCFEFIGVGTLPDRCLVKLANERPLPPLDSPLWVKAKISDN